MTPIVKDSRAGLDLVIEKLERYCLFLEKELENKNKNGSGSDNGTD